MLVLTAAAIVISLVVQGFTLEPLALLAGFAPAWRRLPRARRDRRPAPPGRGGAGTPDELAENDAAPDAVIDRLRAGLQARIGVTRDRMDQDPDTEPAALPERELRADLIAAENAELSRLFQDGTISAGTRQRLQRNLDLEVTRLTERPQ